MSEIDDTPIMQHYEYKISINLYKRMGYFLNGLYDTLDFNIANPNKTFHIEFYMKTYKSLRSKLVGVAYWKALNIFDSIYEDRLEELRKIDRKSPNNPDFRF